MTPEEIFGVFEGICSECGGKIVHWKVEGHPDHLKESWSGSNNELVPNALMPRDYTFHFDEDSWIGNILTVVGATCENGHAHYMERSAVSGDWH